MQPGQLRKLVMLGRTRVIVRGLVQPKHLRGELQTLELLRNYRDEKGK